MNENESKPRLPPGQSKTNRFPVLQKDDVMHVDRPSYTLTVDGEVMQPAKFSLADLQKMMDTEKQVDIHCVTSWSKFDTRWKGVSFQKLMGQVHPSPDAHYVEFLCSDGGFTTTVPIDALSHQDALLALEYEGKLLEDSHGGPVRGIIPNLYFYKSAKWVERITFLKEDRPGYWERGGYSNKADPWKNQRYSHDD